MKDIKNFQERYNRWKNGERYWDIRGIQLSKYDDGKLENNNDFYSWMDKIADKKAQDWTRTPYKPLDPNMVEMQMLNDPTYSYQTFYNLQPFMAQRMLMADPDAHFTDIGKTMYHPTFSDESAFSGYVNDYNPLGITGGHWNEGGTTYTPSKDQLEKYFDYQTTRNYLDRAEDHPVQIVMPAYRGGKNPMSSFVSRMGPLMYRGLKARNVSNIDRAYDYMMRQIALESTYGDAKHSALHNYGGVMSGGKLKQFKSDQDFIDYYLNLVHNKYPGAWNAENLMDYANQLKKGGYYEATPQQYFNRLNGLKTYNRIVQNDLNKNRSLYKQTTGVQLNPQTQQTQFVQPIPIEQQPIQIPMIKPQDIGTLTVPIQQDFPLMLNYNTGKDVYINPVNRGKFNATKKRTGKTTEQLTHSKNPLTRKRAIFALNASKWNH